MPHTGEYEGKTPTKEMKKKGKMMHKMPDGEMMEDKKMKKKYRMTDTGKMKVK